MSKAIRLAVAWTPGSFCEGGWPALSDLLSLGSAGAAGFLDSHPISPSLSTFQPASSTPVDCQQTISAALTALVQQAHNQQDSSAPSAGLADTDFSSLLLAAAARNRLMHGLDAASIETGSVNAVLIQRQSIPDHQPAVQATPDADMIYLISEGIRASIPALQEHSICKAARDFSELLPQLRAIPADAQPLAHGQLLSTLEPVVAELLAWHLSLQPQIQQFISMLSGSQAAATSTAALTRALMADLLFAYVAGLAELLQACGQLPCSEEASQQQLAQPLLGWTQQLFEDLAALAGAAIDELVAALAHENSSCEVISQILGLGLLFDEV